MTELNPGSVFAGYQIEGVIGKGGMATVFLARDIRLGRQVALKVLLPSLAEDPAFRQRFVRESQIAAALEHPHVVPVYEAGETRGYLFIAMRYIDGTDLRVLLSREGPLSCERTVRIVSQISGALDAAHRRGLVHRDVKPANILIAHVEENDREDHSYLTDFGITRRISGYALTRTGVFVGTLDYAAPEQIRGELVDARTDIYALGCVLFECLTGRPPFEADSDVALMYAHLERDPPTVTALRPELPGSVDGVVYKAMAKNPADRFVTCESLAETLLEQADRDSLPPTAQYGTPSLSARRALGRGLARITEHEQTPKREPVRLFRHRRRKAFLAVLTIGTTVAIVGIVLGVTQREPTSVHISATVTVGGWPSGVAEAGDSLWVANSGSRSVSRISKRTRRVTATVDVGRLPKDIFALPDSSIWTIAATDRQVWRIDPRTNRGDVVYRVPDYPIRAIFAEGSIWFVLGPDSNTNVHQVMRFDPVARKPISSRFIPNQELWDIAVLGDVVYVVGRDYILLYDADTMQDLGQAPAPSARRIARGTNAVYVSNSVKCDDRGQACKGVRITRIESSPYAGGVSQPATRHAPATDDRSMQWLPATKAEPETTSKPAHGGDSRTTVLHSSRPVTVPTSGDGYGLIATESGVLIVDGERLQLLDAKSLRVARVATLSNRVRTVACLHPMGQEIIVCDNLDETPMDDEAPMGEVVMLERPDAF